MREDIQNKFDYLTFSHAVILSGRIVSAMAEVRVHAAFTVKDEGLFLSEAKKMIAATQVNNISSSMQSQYSSFLRKRKVVSSTNSSKRRERKRVTP